MKFIESEELREWVKDSLRKTIFQKAHALAVQTGCEVLVKLQDATDNMGRQYYATHNLQRAYATNTLRKHPAEMFVSGETGLPLVNQATQIGDFVSEGTDASLQIDNGDMVQELSERPLSNEGAIPTRLTFANQTDNGQVEGNTDMTGVVQVKMEEMSDEDSATAEVSLESSTGQSGMDTDSFTDNQGFSGSHLATGSQKYPKSQSPHLYQCALCQKTFRSIHILQMHTQTFHLRGSTTFSPTRTLNIRGKGRSNRKSMMKLEQEQKSLSRYPCMVCERTFHHPDLLKDHVSRSHMGQSMLASSMKAFQVSSSTSTATTDTSSTPSQMPVSTAGPSLNLQNTPMLSSSDLEHPGGGVLDPHVQMSTMKQLPHTESFLSSLGNLPSASSSLFGQGPSTVPFRHHGGGAAGRTNALMASQAEQKGPMPTIKIMKAILAIGGPISTANTVKDNLRNRNYDRVTNELFVEAANQLKDIGLGYLVSCKNGSGRLVDVFIKKPPEEVMDILEAKSELCDPSVYISTFASQTPVRLMRSSQLMENLIASGLVAEEHLKSHQAKSDSNDVGHSSMGFFDGSPGFLNPDMQIAHTDSFHESFVTDQHVADQHVTDQQQQQ